MTGGRAGRAAWHAAEALVGVPFRLQGRDPVTGLDCIGLIVAAYADAGIRLQAPDDYGLRGMTARAVIAALDQSGLRPCAAPVAAGDVGLFLLPAGQMHLAMLAPGRIVHADLALRRVAAAPDARLPPPHARWRWRSIKGLPAR
jgi:cell wall-associated NlpC family hydrolase